MCPVDAGAASVYVRCMAEHVAGKTGRLNVKINEDTADAFTRLIQPSKDVNATEVVRRAVALLDMITTERAKGKEVELVAVDESRERLRFIY